MITNKKERITSQKKVILDYLKSAKNHPSTKEIFKKVRKKLPRISLGTVYRILKSLKENEKIQEISNEVCRYDGDLTPHSHFICKECQQIFDVFEKFAILRYKKLKVGTIKNYQIYFYGYCKKCRSKMS